MKCLIVTCLKENSNTVYQIFKEANIKTFSTTDVTGFKDAEAENLLGAWFAAGDEKFDSLMMFSFTSTAQANNGMELIKQFNSNFASNFPIRAFIIPVESTSFKRNP